MGKSSRGSAIGLSGASKEQDPYKYEKSYDKATATAGNDGCLKGVEQGSGSLSSSVGSYRNVK